MTYATAVAVLMVPLPATVWVVGHLLTEYIPKDWVETRSAAVWSVRFIAYMVQIGLLTLAQNIALEATAVTGLQQLLDQIVFVGMVGFWTGASALLILYFYQVINFIKRRLEETGHALKLG